MCPTEWCWRRPAFNTTQTMPRSSRQWKVAELLNRASDSKGLHPCISPTSSKTTSVPLGIPQLPMDLFAKLKDADRAQCQRH
jgi:hypothetical protein